MFVSAYRATTFAFQNFWRNFWLSLITVTMLILTLFTVNILVVLNLVTDRAIQAVGDRVEISVYFESSTKDVKVQNAVTYLRSLTQVRDVQTISAQDALDQFTARHQNDETIIQSLKEIGGNPFGPGLVIKAHTVGDFDVILESLDNPEFRDQIREKDFSDYQQIISRIKDTTDHIRAIGLVVTAIFLLIAILIVFNTVRMSIFIHREEIGIMKLVGASNGFIRAPFLLEMMLLSLLAIGITVGVVFSIISILEPRIGPYFGSATIGLVQYFQQNGWQIFGIQFLALVILTLFSTSLAMRKYLKV